MNDPFESLPSEMPKPEEDCNCGKKNRLASTSQLPSPKELEASLTTLLAGDVFAGGELNLAMADDLFGGGIDLPATMEAGQVQLPQLIALVERYPGLKITLSFG